jgi:hypothetical protein
MLMFFIPFSSSIGLLLPHLLQHMVAISLLRHMNESYNCFYTFPFLDYPSISTTVSTGGDASASKSMVRSP